MNQEEWVPYLKEGQFESAFGLGVNHVVIEGELPKNVNQEINRRVTLSEFDGQINRKNVRQVVASLRFDYDWVSIKPKNVKVLVDAISSRQVDAIQLSSSSPFKLAHQKYLTLLREHSKILEIDLKPLFSFLQNQKEVTKLLKLFNFIRQKPPHVVLINSSPEKTSFRRYRNLQTVGEALGIERKFTSIKPFVQKILENRRRRQGLIISGDIEVEQK